MITLTDDHAKYYAHKLTKRYSSDSAEKLAGALVDTQVDLTPHQVEATLFAFRSPQQDAEGLLQCYSSSIGTESE